MNIYVGNISYNMTPDEIRRVFLPFGNVLSVRIITDKQTKKSKGFAFVEMEKDEEALLAIKTLNETEVKGRNIKVNSGHRKAELAKH